MRRNVRRDNKAERARSVVVPLTFTMMLVAGTMGGSLIARGTEPATARAESDAYACEHNRCAAGKMCVDSEFAPVATRCDAIGRGGECVTLPCGGIGTTILNLLRFPSSESGDRLVALGPVAANAVLGYAGLPEPYAGRSQALETLAQMVDTWGTEAFEEEDLKRLYQLAGLYLGPSPSHLDVEERVSVAVAAIDLALALNDPELRAVVQRIASSPGHARVRLGRKVDYGRLTEHARARLSLDSIQGNS